MKKSIKNLINSIRRACWDAEVVWLATRNREVFVDIEPPGHSDRIVARDLSIKLTSHTRHPELGWQQVFQNLGEES